MVLFYLNFHLFGRVWSYSNMIITSKVEVFRKYILAIKDVWWFRNKLCKDVNLSYNDLFCSCALFSFWGEACFIIDYLSTKCFVESLYVPITQTRATNPSTVILFALISTFSSREILRQYISKIIHFL